MTQADKKLEAEIRQRAISGLPLKNATSEAIAFCQTDRSYLLAALDREREKTKRLRDAIETEVKAVKGFWDEGVFSINTIDQRTREALKNLTT